MADAKPNSSPLQEFLDDQRSVLVGYTAMRAWFGKDMDVPRVWPPSVLTEEECEDLDDRLRGTMPRDSIILDLWNLDVHFEDDLDADWLYGCAFGPESSVDWCADALAEFFLDTCRRYDLDYDQHRDPEGFEEWLYDEVRKYVVDWRKAIAAEFMGGRNATQGQL